MKYTDQNGEEWTFQKGELPMPIVEPIRRIPYTEHIPANPHRLIKIREGLYVAASAIVSVNVAASAIVSVNVQGIDLEVVWSVPGYSIDGNEIRQNREVVRDLGNDIAMRECARIVAEVNLPPVDLLTGKPVYPPIGYWPPDWLKKIPGDFDKFETIDTGSELPVEVIPPGQVMVFNVFPGVRLVNDSDKPLYVHAVKLSQPKD